MKRSEINAIMRSADAFIKGHGFLLPPFAYWSPGQWRTKGPESAEIVRNCLGWDITDFGSGDFAKRGLFLFTVRNGRHGEAGTKPYAEKIMIVEVGQETPMHFHWSKQEDIINRGGGRLLIELYNATKDEDLDRTGEVLVSIDGTQRRLAPGTKVSLAPGESITLTRRLYHRFWGEDARVLVGEVSAVNDDRTDNRFHQPIGRFPVIDEDEAPFYPLVGDYQGLYRH